MNPILQAIKSLFRKLENSIPKKLSELENDLKLPTPDWNENSQNAKDYIKNRPFYEEITEFAWVEEQTITIVDGLCSLVRNDLEDWWPIIGSPYTVIFDGVAYSGTTYEDSDMCTHTDFTTDNGVFVQIFNGRHLNANSTALDGEHTIRITVMKSTVHQIDDKYIDHKVLSVNGKTGYIHITANSIGAATTSQINGKMEKTNPSGTGSFSMNRKSGTAIGNCSHTEGDNNTANGPYSHAEGSSNTASGGSSHVEGANNTAYGSYSHAEGFGNIAKNKSQHVQGEYNIQDPYTNSYVNKGKYAHIVGNGTSGTTRSNAHTLDWSGVGWYQGGLQVGGNAQDDGAKSVLLEGDAIPVPATATVGQTLTVKSVDKNGKPTEWETVDAPSGESAYPGDDHINNLIDVAIDNLEVPEGGSGAGVVVSDSEPDDTSVLWIDTDDNEADNLQAAIDDALSQAKASGEFKGDPGDDYVLTEADKQEIAELTAPLVDVPGGGGSSGWGEWETINVITTTLEEEVTEINVNADANGNSFEYDELKLTFSDLRGSSANNCYIWVNRTGYNWQRKATMAAMLVSNAQNQFMHLSEMIQDANGGWFAVAHSSRSTTFTMLSAEGKGKYTAFGFKSESAGVYINVKLTLQGRNRA